MNELSEMGLLNELGSKSENPMSIQFDIYGFCVFGVVCLRARKGRISWLDFLIGMIKGIVRIRLILF